MWHAGCRSGPVFDPNENILPRTQRCRPENASSIWLSQSLYAVVLAALSIRGPPSTHMTVGAGLFALLTLFGILFNIFFGFAQPFSESTKTYTEINVN